MTPRQTPDAVREAVAKVLYDFRPGCGWETVKGRPASYAIPWDEACADYKEDAYRETDAILAALDSRAGGAGEGLVLPPGWKPWTGGPFTPQDYAGRYMLRNRSFHDWRPGNGAGPSWKWEYGEGDIVAYLATPAPAVDAVPAGEVE